MLQHSCCTACQQTRSACLQEFAHVVQHASRLAQHCLRGRAPHPSLARNRPRGACCPWARSGLSGGGKLAMQLRDSTCRRCTMLQHSCCTACQQACSACLQAFANVAQPASRLAQPACEGRRSDVSLHNGVCLGMRVRSCSVCVCVCVCVCVGARVEVRA